MDLKQKHNPTELSKSTTELTNLMRDVLDRASKKGATSASVSVGKDRGFSVDVRMGGVETVEFSEDKSVSLSLYFGQRKGSASSTDTSDASLDRLVNAACDIARVSAEDCCFGLADKELATTDFPELDLYHPWDITTEQAITMAIDCERQALALDKRIENSDGVHVSSYAAHHGFANSHGTLGVTHSTRHGLSCSLIAKMGDEMQRDYDYTNARTVEGLFASEVVAKNAVDRAISRLGARQVKTQKVPVVFSSRISSGLISTLISAISGTNLYRKNSFLVDGMGQMIFPEFIDIYEQPHIPRGLGSAAFDSEGVLTRANQFIKKGVINQYLLGSYSARRLGLKTTANSDGAHNVTVNATHKGLDDLLKEMDRGFLVTELMGQGINMITGDYSRGASGFWVENGVIQFPVEGVTIAGNLKDMFLNLRGVGADINPNMATHCGSLLLDEMMVAGS